MADDILDDLDEDLSSDLDADLDEDILGESGDEDFDEDFDSDDLDDLDDDPDEEDIDVKDGSEKTESSKKNIIAGLMDRIPEKFRTKKVLIIIAAAFLLVILLVAGLVIFLFGSGSDEAALPEDPPAVSTGLQPEDEIIFEDIVALAPFERIHLKTSSTMGLISINLSLELTDHRYRKQVYALEDRIREIVETQVAEMTWLELRNPEGKIRLKYDLLKRINSLFPQTTVRHVYFTFLIMQ